MSDRRTGSFDGDTLTVRIRERYDALSGAERKLADAILDCPGQLAGYTATELSELAGVSKMTVSRFVRRLGFENYEQARVAARGGTDWGSPLYLLPSDTQETPGVAAHLRRSLEAIEATTRGLSPDLVVRAAEKLCSAQRIWVYGIRNNSFLAGYARWQFIQLRPGVHNMTRAGETLAETLAEVGPDDVLFIAATRRRPPIVRRLLETAAKRGLSCILLVDNHSPVEGPCPELTFSCETRSLMPLDDHASAMVVIHALVAEVFRLIGADGRKHIRRIEDLHEDLGEM